MHKDLMYALNMAYAGRVLALIAAAGFAARGLVVPDELRDAETDAESFHVLVWLCFASLSLGLFCALGVLGRLAEGMDTK